ncbi:MAG: hypothetical protein COA45_11995 [Zetaproteobacteria bacterium]|nr:MAG: hypothetical protein COA45_11995 [Zetaproteobacteria bacterium]
MLFQIQRSLSDFFERNLFERIIIYLFLSAFISKFVFELVLGQWSFVQSQNKQWLFYGFLALDYIISFKKIMNMRVTINPLSLFALLFFIMIAHGLFIGITSHNTPFKILDDTIPLLMIALNILRMQSYAEMKNPIDFRFILNTTTWLAFIACLFGLLGQTLGKPTRAGIIENSIYLPIVFAALFTLKPFPKKVGIMFVIMVILSMSALNRTSMLFFVLMISTYSLLQIIKSPSKGLLTMIAVIISCSMFWIMLPKGSSTYNRIVGIAAIDLSARTGSVGERQAEQDAVAAKLELGGTTRQWTGLGFGGTYEVQFTHKYLKNYGHAHYAWVWFNLRFGYIGYIYLSILTSILLYNGTRGLLLKTETSIFISLLCLSGLIYLMTYVNALFLASGIQFLYINNRYKSKT